MNRGNPWLRYTRCEECGAPAKNACRTEDDEVADEPCPGRRLNGAGVVDVALAPHVKPAASEKRASAPVPEAVVLADKCDRIRDAVAQQPDGLRAALAVIDQVRAILAPPQTVPDDTVSEAP